MFIPSINGLSYSAEGKTTTHTNQNITAIKIEAANRMKSSDGSSSIQQQHHRWRGRRQNNNNFV